MSRRVLILDLHGVLGSRVHRDDDFTSGIKLFPGVRGALRELTREADVVVWSSAKLRNYQPRLERALDDPATFAKLQFLSEFHCTPELGKPYHVALRRFGDAPDLLIVDDSPGKLLGWDPAKALIVQRMSEDGGASAEYVFSCLLHWARTGEKLWHQVPCMILSPRAQLMGTAKEP